MSSEGVIKIDSYDHHIRQKVCQTRSPYRRGRKDRAVKVFTISDESKYLLIQKVPDFKSDIKQELRKLCQRFGPIERLDLSHYSNCEEFTKTYLIKFKHFVNALKAKKTLDDYNFLGSILHVCYAPEMETIDETREKLYLRKRFVPQIVYKKQNISQKSEQIVSEKLDIQTNKMDIKSSDRKSDNISTNSKRKFSEISDHLIENQTQNESKSKSQKESPKIRWKTNTSNDTLS